MGLLPAAVLALVAYTGSFTRYLADDYCSVYWAQRFGLLRSVWYWYINWSGRFSAYASDWFVTLLGARSVRFIPPVMLLVWLAATILAVRFFLRRERSGRGWLMPILLGVILLFAVFTAMPSVQQSFYWWNGMRSYTLPLILLTIFAALAQWGLPKVQTTRSAILASALSFMAMFLIAGLSETYAVAQLGLLCVLVAFGFAAKPRQNQSLVILGAGAVGTALALAVIALAPGNVFREASFPHHPGLMRLVGINLQAYSSLIGGIVAAPPKILGLLGAVLAAVWAGTAESGQPLARPRTIGIMLAIGLLLSFGAMLPASWGLSEPGPSRNMSVPVFVLVVSLMAAAFIAGSQPRGAARGPALPLVLATCAVVTLGVSGFLGLRKTYVDVGTYARYAQNWDAEEAQILRAKASRAGTVTVASWPNWAGLDVLSEHPKNWLNTCTSGYYGIEVIGRAP